MDGLRRWVGMQLWMAVLLGTVGVLLGERAIATEPPTNSGIVEANSTTSPPTDPSLHPSSFLLPLSPATTLREWQAQIAQFLVRVTDVKLQVGEEGVTVTLITENGVLPIPEPRTLGNALIVDIANATLENAFSEANPIEGIALVEVMSLPGDRIRVAITGTDAPPTAQISSGTQQFTLNVALGTAADATDDEEIQVLVTGQQEGYNPLNATTATRTDTPLRDIPQSIQIVPRQVLEDRNVRTVSEAVETVSGVVESRSTFGSSTPFAVLRSIRGFEEDSQTNLRNGLRDGTFLSISPIGTVERVEVLKGPASVLFGSLEPGGAINLITRQPLSEPYYRLGFQAGSFGRYQPSIDFSGSLTTDESVLYRLIAAYQGGEDFQDFTRTQITTIAPSFTLRIGDRTNLSLYYEYGRYNADSSTYTPPILSDGSLPPASFYPTYFSSVNVESHRLGYTLNHELNDDWQIHNNLAANFSTYFLRETFYSDLLNNQFLTGFGSFVADQAVSTYVGQIDLVGRFETGSIPHQLVAGFDFNRLIDYIGTASGSDVLPDLDVFNPNYDVPIPDFPSTPFTSLTTSQFYGIYLQDQIAFSDNLKMLIGGRYDWLVNESGSISGDRTSQSDGAFSPRIGLVYQPSENISLYTSYSQSFRPSIGRNPDSRAFEPTRGTQYEVGTKADFLDGRLSANLAAYNLTSTNVLTPGLDPILVQQGFQVQVGEQRSRGIELDVSGEILPG